MIRQLVVLGLIVTVVGLRTANSAAEELAPKDGGFSIDMPGKATETTQSVNMPAGKIEFKLYSFSAKDNTYLVSYNDYPADALKGQSTDKQLDAVRDGAVTHLKGKLAKEEKIMLGPNPGREVLIVAPEDGGFVRMRMYVVKNRLYQVILTETNNDKSFVTGPDADKFFNSFKLTGK